MDRPCMELFIQEPHNRLALSSRPPFPGHHIVTCASTEWYERDACVGDGQVSKYVGCDQTGGSSGGPWWINIRHPNNAFEYAPRDGSLDTDPGQGLSTAPFLNGVNSHRWTNAWVNEIGSPQFINSPGDTQEAEDIFQSCFAAE